MIENIKRFVNEHCTLIVVIICALIICFLYWWFCCKDKPSANKVKGGVVHTVGLKFDVRYQKKDYNVLFLCEGMNIDDSNGRCPVYVLTEEGEKDVIKNKLNVFSVLIDELEYGDNSISQAFYNALNILFGNGDYSEAVAHYLNRRQPITSYLR